MTLIMWQDGAPFEAIWNDRMNAAFPQGLNASSLASGTSALSVSGLETTNATSLLTNVGLDNGSSGDDVATA